VFLHLCNNVTMSRPLARPDSRRSGSPAQQSAAGGLQVGSIPHTRGVAACQVTVGMARSGEGSGTPAAAGVLGARWPAALWCRRAHG
jgi:hypothetical protein